MATDALIGLALTSAKSGDGEAARAYYQQVLAKDPTNQSALIGLSSIVGGTSSAAPSPSGSK
jgi:TolA-binding protein